MLRRKVLKVVVVNTKSYCGCYSCLLLKFLWLLVDRYCNYFHCLSVETVGIAIVNEISDVIKPVAVEQLAMQLSITLLTSTANNTNISVANRCD